MDLLKILVDEKLNVSVSTHLLMLGIVVLGFLLFFIGKLFFNNKLLKNTFEINETEIGIGTNKFKIRPNYTDMQIAYQLWVELSTRKIGLPINYENDFFIEVYNSWYEFFQITRELIKNIPIQSINRKEDTKKLLELSIRVLNDGLRPHLTIWQTKFRHWYKVQEDSKKYSELSPQEIQKKFPEYQELVDDMKKVNARLIKYRELLGSIALK